MGELAKVPNYQVKVDNWSLFFLQRLNHFYKKNYHCDLTLVFSTLNTVKSIKVHRLVLHACTDYFESLEINTDPELGQCLQLSDEMHPDVVIPIISFMYTGKLEFPASLQSRLYEAASKLRMTILTKLLDAQPKQPAQPSVTSRSEESLSQSSGFQCNADEPSPEGQKTAVQVLQLMTNTSSSASPKPVEDSVVTLNPLPMVSTQKTIVKSEGVHLRTNNFDVVKASSTAVFKAKPIRNESGSLTGEISVKGKMVDLSLPPTLPGRKLPIWKRKVPFTGSQLSSDNSTEVLTSERMYTETPKPTRFEWDEDLNDPTILRPVEDALRALAHDVTSEIQHPVNLDGEVNSSQKDKDSSCNDLKRNSPSSPNSPDSPPFKRSRTDLQDMKEYGKQQQLRNEILCNEENSEDGMDPDDLYGSCDEESQDLSCSSQTGLNSSPPKPILKSLSKPEPSQPASKRVRFSLEGKENNKKANDFSTLAKKPGTVLTKQKIVLPMNVNQIRTGGQHVKIVSEVLKKYPNLTKRDNVKLKVVSKIPAAVPPTVQHAVEGDVGSGNKSAASHVSYIYVMNESPNQVSNVQLVSGEKEKEFDVENRTGPWICNSCDPSNPIQFDSYYTYRRHLVEIHEMKIDARICEYCGLRSSKRNHLLYHLYTKHNIDPPAHVSFPKCTECDYIALSDALLVKHKSVHETKELLTCYVCNVVFKTFSSMQIHLQSASHKKKITDISSSSSKYPCPFCDNQFSSGKDLKDHIEENHQSQLQYSEDSGQDSQLENSMTGENQECSDLESLNNVTTGIVTSMNLIGNEQTVVYYEQQAGNQDIGGEAIVMTGEDCKDFIIPGSVGEIEPSGDYQRAELSDDTVSVDNEDSNSRNSNVEEVNPTSCSDHDYSEPQSDESIRQVIPLQQVTDNYQGAPIIQQILPDQQLVFTSQPNVMFQSSRINLPQRVLLTPGNVVLSPISHHGQNVILPQVFPRTRIILSNQLIQQPTNLLRDSGNAIVFANSEVQPHGVENVETLSYVEAAPEMAKERDEKNDLVAVEEHGMVLEEENRERAACNEQVDGSLTLNVLMGEEEEEEVEKKPPNEDDEEEGDEEEEVVGSGEDQKALMAPGRAKIVDDWDETNETSQNVESRSDGPSRPEFF